MSIVAPCITCTWMTDTVCGGCNRAFYCSTRCQAAHWPSHQNDCLLLCSPKMTMVPSPRRIPVVVQNEPPAPIVLGQSPGREPVIRGAPVKKEDYTPELEGSAPTREPPKLEGSKIIVKAKPVLEGSAAVKVKKSEDAAEPVVRGQPALSRRERKLMSANDSLQ